MWCSILTAVCLCLGFIPDDVNSQRYIVPEATLELLSPRGLKISIPDIDKGVTLVAFHININEEFQSLTHGHFAQDIIKKRDGKWSYYIPDFKVKQGDTIYYWIYVVVDGLAYHGLDRVYKVTSFIPEDVHSQRYIVPEATLELLSPRGLKISIPDIDKGVTLVAFHININEEFMSLTHGHFAQDIIKKRDGKWSYYIPDFKVKQGDTIYYWIYVVVDGLAYHGLDRVYKVTKSDPHGTGSTESPPVVTEVTVDRVTEPSPCQPSLTSRDRDINLCKGQTILDKRFDSLDGWSHQVQIGGNHVDDEFTVFSKDSDVSFIEDGNLVIKPILLEHKYSESFVRTGTLTLDGCTSIVPDQCSKQGAAYLILPPVMSARLTTKDSFNFRYGTVEIVAKLPNGDWIVPEIWLEAKTRRSLRAVIGLSRGNVQFSSADSNWLLEAGVIVNGTQHFDRMTKDTQWSREYHIFKLAWTPEVMIFSVDNQEVTRIVAANVITLFDKQFYITLGVHVGGGRDFLDGAQGKPWKNSDPKSILRFWQAKNAWYPSWSSDSALRVKSVKVTAL